MTPIVRKLGPKANPALLKDIPIKSFLIWAFYIGEPTNPLFPVGHADLLFHDDDLVCSKRTP